MAGSTNSFRGAPPGETPGTTPVPQSTAPRPDWSTFKQTAPSTSSPVGQHDPTVPAAPTNPDNNLLTQGNREQFYGDTSQQYKDPSYSEQLVQQGMGGQLNDYYDFANNKLNDQYAAMGGGPSGALLRASQGLRANQAHDMMDYTQAADNIHYGRLAAGQNAAGSADSGQIDRLNTAFNAANGLANGESASANGFYNTASTSSNPYTQQAIDNGVTKSTIDPAKSAFGDGINLVSGAVKDYYGASAKK